MLRRHPHRVPARPRSLPVHLNGAADSATKVDHGRPNASASGPLGWTDARLGTLLERYRRKYWPKSRRLRRYRIHVAPVERGYGEIDPKGQVLRIDISAHTTDRRVRATVLHEMIHAAVGVGHGVQFWAEMERLLKMRAPIEVGFPEMGEQSRHLCVIPKRFRRCRALFRRVYLRQQRELRGPGHTVTPEEMASECEDAAAEQDLKWRDVWGEMVRRYGFVDMDGRLLPSAQRYRNACQKAYRRGRRTFLETQRAAALLGLQV